MREGEEPPLNPINKSMPLVQEDKTAEKTDDLVAAEGEGDHQTPHTPAQPDDSLIKAKTGEGEGRTRAPSPPNTNLQMIDKNAYVGCHQNRYYLPSAAE